MAETDEGTPARIVHQWAAAFISGDSIAVATLYDEDGIWEETGVEPISGRANIADYLAVGLTYATYSEMEPRVVAIGHGAVVAEWTWTGTSSTHARAASDQTPFSTTGITVFEMDDDLIARGLIYYDHDDLFN